MYRSDEILQNNGYATLIVNYIYIYIYIYILREIEREGESERERERGGVHIISIQLVMYVRRSSCSGHEAKLHLMVRLQF